MSTRTWYGAVAVVAVLIGVYAWKASDTGLPKHLSEWQAVFLSDGQVYFGRLQPHNRRFYLLTDIYYLKYGSALQQGTDADDALPEQKLNLIKLGGELHGPEDEMYIAKDKVIFIENLKDASPVVQAIKKTN